MRTNSNSVAHSLVSMRTNFNSATHYSTLGRIDFDLTTHLTSVSPILGSHPSDLVWTPFKLEIDASNVGHIVHAPEAWVRTNQTCQMCSSMLHEKTRMLFIICWKTIGALVRPNNITSYWKWSCHVWNVIFHSLVDLIWTRFYAPLMSMLDKTWVFRRRSRSFRIKGNG